MVLVMFSAKVFMFVSKRKLFFNMIQTDEILYIISFPTKECDILHVFINQL
jgi:hypothetical protein